MNFLFAISKDDIPIINEYLKVLVQKSVLSVKEMNNLCNNDTEKAKSLGAFIVRNECARFHANNDGTIVSNSITKEYYEQKYLEKLILKEKDKKEKDDLGIEKLKLEIHKLKRERWVSYASLIISIAAIIVSILNMLKR